MKYQHVKHWKRVEISDRRIFFFSKDYNMSFMPHDADKQSNFIYLLQCEDFGEKLYKINLETRTFSSFILPKKFLTIWNRSCWVIPSRSRAKKEKLVSCQKNCSDEKCEEKITKKVCAITENISRPWADLPIELVQLLLPHLGLADCIRLPTVCKAWSDLSNPLLEAKIWPLLMYFSSDCNTCRLFDPICNQEFSLDMEWFAHGEECNLHFSKDGWVLLSKGYSTYVVNPFTRETVKVPFYHTSYPCSFAFYSLPTSEDFMIFVACGDHEKYPEGMALWWHGETRWSSWTSEVDLADDLEVEFSYLNMGWGNAVFLEELIYCLERRGDLGVLDPWDDTSQVIYETPVHDDTPAVGSEDCYLLEVDGELISVFRERTKTNVRIFTLDHDDWAWNKQEDLGDLTLFLHHRGSVAKKLKLGRGYANRIYLSGFDVQGERKVGAYYSVDSASYNASLDSLQFPMNCVWFEPNFTVNKNSANSS